MGSLCALRIVEILNVSAIWATLGPLVRSSAVTTYLVVDNLSKSKQIYVSLHQTDVTRRSDLQARALLGPKIPRCTHRSILMIDAVVIVILIVIAIVVCILTSIVVDIIAVTIISYE